MADHTEAEKTLARVAAAMTLGGASRQDSQAVLAWFRAVHPDRNPGSPAAVIIRLACADTGQADQVAAAIAETGRLCYTDGSGKIEILVTAVSVEP